MNTTITLSLNAREGNPRNSEGSFITLKDGRILFAYSHYRDKEDWSDHAETWSDPVCCIRRIEWNELPGVRALHGNMNGRDL